MQALYILRGCLAAYGAGVIAIGLGAIVIDGAGLEVFGVTAVFGLFALVPLLLIAFIIWGALAAQSVRVSWWQAMAVCAAVFFGLTTLAALADGDVLAALAVSGASPFIGGAFGAVFWAGAFGLRRDMVMGIRMPKEAP